ncbi:response regulator [Acidaminobacter sp. JC074]|uniref:response regulator n=1 Tax=Acidaminobacter sp. JC074 TaxID=2530199 RepID=UPI001F0E62A0|nr:response regulator [Acidaminobacter sp. JC074]MCH4890788.1 response regulator [Acidaminobacter sp. JC074]
MDYFEILNTLGDGVLCVDRQLNIVYANRKAMQLLNVSIDELLLKPVDKWFDVMSKDGPIIKDIVTGVFTTGQQSGLCKNSYIMTPYGIAMYISASISRVSKDNHTDTVVINFREVSEMVMHEKEVNHSKENLQQIINKFPYGLVFLDQDNYVEACNEYIERSFQTKLGQGEKIGDLLKCKNTSDSKCGCTDTCHQCLLSSTLNNHKPYNQIIQCRMTHQIDNKMIEDDYEVNVVSFKENRLDKTFVVIRNVTTENSFRRELVTSKIQESVKVQLQDVFYSYVSNDLVDMVEDLIDPLEKLIEFPEEVRNRHLYDTKYKSKIIRKEVEGIKHFRSLENINKKVNPSHFIVADMIKENVDMFKKLYLDKGLNIQTDLSSLINTKIYQDKEKLGFIIRQLIKNVVGAIDHGNIHLKAYIHGGSLIIKILTSSKFDKSCGISKKLLNEGLSSPCDLHPSSSLILVKKLVELLNGHIRYKIDNEDHNAITTLFPLETPNLKIDKSMNNKVLVMEDDIVQQIIISKMLESMGYEVTMTDNGEDGLKSFLMNSYMTTLVDIQMPKKNGYEVIYEIKRLKPTERVIAMSTLSSKREREEVMKAGFDLFLSKPIKYDNLRACLKDRTQSELSYYRYEDAYKTLKDAVMLKNTVTVNDLIEDLRLKSQSEHIHHLLFKAKIAYRKGRMDEALEHVDHAYEMEKKDASTYSRR